MKRTPKPKTANPTPQELSQEGRFRRQGLLDSRHSGPTHGIAVGSNGNTRQQQLEARFRQQGQEAEAAWEEATASSTEVVSTNVSSLSTLPSNLSALGDKRILAKMRQTHDEFAEAEEQQSEQDWGQQPHEQKQEEPAGQQGWERQTDDQDLKEGLSSLEQDGPYVAESLKEMTAGQIREHKEMVQWQLEAARYKLQVTTRESLEAETWVHKLNLELVRIHGMGG